MTNQFWSNQIITSLVIIIIAHKNHKRYPYHTTPHRDIGTPLNRLHYALYQNRRNAHQSNFIPFILIKNTSSYQPLRATRGCYAPVHLVPADLAVAPRLKLVPRLRPVPAVPPAPVVVLLPQLVPQYRTHHRLRRRPGAGVPCPTWCYVRRADAWWSWLRCETYMGSTGRRSESRRWPCHSPSLGACEGSRPRSTFGRSGDRCAAAAWRSGRVAPLENEKGTRGWMNYY